MLRKLVFLVALLSGCYANATAARVDQTRGARGFFCLQEPRIQCAPDRECSGWDETWQAYCGDKVFICKFIRHTDRPSETECERQEH